MTLLSDKALYADAFRVDGNQNNSNLWKDSDIRRTLNGGKNVVGMDDVGFAGEAFIESEWAIIQEHECHFENNIGIFSGASTYDKAYLLSNQEIDDLHLGTSEGKASATEFCARVRKYGNNGEAQIHDGAVFWWKRTPYAEIHSTNSNGYNCAQYINTAGGGSIYSTTVGNVWRWDYSVRPATDVELTDIIFTSGAGNGSKLDEQRAGKFLKFTDVSSSTLDVWLDDTKKTVRYTGDVSVCGTLDLTGSNLSIAYTGAKQGAGSYVSVLFFSESGYNYTNDAGTLSQGTLLGYGKGNSEVVSTNDITAMNIMDLEQGNYRMELFNENSILIGQRAEIKGIFGIDSSKNLNYTVEAEELQFHVSVDANNTVTLKDGTLRKNISGNGTMEINGIVYANADYIHATTNIVKEDSVLTLTRGTLVENIQNNGTLKTAGNVVISSSISGGTGGTLVVESGTLQYTNTTAESITNNVEIKAGATLDPDAGVFATGTTVTNYGTLEITGGTLAATIDCKGGDNLVMKGRMEIGTGGAVKQSADSNITVEASLIESESNDPSKAMFGGIDDADKLDVGNGNLTINGRITKDKYYVLVAGTAVSGGTVTGATLWKLENIDFSGVLMVDYDVNATGGSIALYINSVTSREEAYTSGLAAVQQGNITAAKEFTEETEKHLGLAYRGAIKDTGKYDKEVWANIIHTKEKTDGMDLGAGIENNNTAQYNGTVVGTDFYTSKKAITGMAIGYIDGNINSQSGSTSTRNEAKYYGVSLYNRVTNGNTALIYDAAYIRGDNDIRQHSNGQEVTADAKTDTYIAGVRYETEVKLGRSKLVPFASFRYMRVNNRDYSNSNNTKFETDNQNMYIPKAGIAWTGKFIMPQSAWTWRPHIEGGYMWNLGDRSVASDVWCGSKLANIEYDTTDKGSYYVKAGMEFICKNLTAGVFYRYLKGDAVRNNRWNLNVNWSF